MHTIDTIMKNIVNLRIHVAPVGFEVDRIVIPAVRMKADKVWLVVHDSIYSMHTMPMIFNNFGPIIIV